jgi:hypothetical protein
MINEFRYEYGSVPYYRELLSDLIADVQHDDPDLGDKLVEAFKLAIADWREYHAAQAQELDRISTKLNDQD